MDHRVRIAERSGSYEERAAAKRRAGELAAWQIELLAQMNATGFRPEGKVWNCWERGPCPSHIVDAVIATHRQVALDAFKSGLDRRFNAWVQGCMDKLVDADPWSRIRKYNVLQRYLGDYKNAGTTQGMLMYLIERKITLEGLREEVIEWTLSYDPSVES